MSKRARSAASLSDLNPQFLSIAVISAATDVYTTVQVALPVTRIGGSKNKAMVFEILAVHWYLDIADGFEDTQWSNFTFLSTGTRVSITSAIPRTLTTRSCPQR